MMPVFGILALGAIWSAYWFVAITHTERAVAQWRERMAADGFTLACAAESWGGYPFRFAFTCESPAFTSSRGIAAKSVAMTALAQAYNPWHVIVLLDGPTTLRAGNAPQLDATHERVIASLKIRDAAPAEVSVEIPQLIIPKWLTAAKVLGHGRPEAGGALGIAWSIDNLAYQPEGRPPLHIARSDFTGTLKPNAELAVHGVALQEGPVSCRGTGTVGLDSQRRVTGLLNTETNDPDGLLLILDPHLELNGQQRAAFKTVLGLLGQQAKIDLIAKDGEFYIGPFKIADLVPLF